MCQIIICINSSQKGFVFLKNGLFVHKKTERPFFLKAVRFFVKGCSFIKNGLFVYQTAVMFLPEACDFSNGQL